MTIFIKLVNSALFLTISFAINSQQFVVLESSIQSYKKGQIVNSATQITLDKNTELTLISEQGKLIKIKGSYDGIIGDDVTLNHEKNGVAKGASLIDSLSMLLMKNQKQSLGAARSLEGISTENDAINTLKKPWAIDVNATGDQCSLNRQTLLWRNNNVASVVLKQKLKDTIATVHWKAGDAYSQWPKTIHREDKQIYQLIVSGDYQVKEITLHLFNVEVNSEKINQALWMTKRGCYPQASLLLSSIEMDQIIDKKVKR
ncbi:MAG: hypothetical protein JKY81_08220 [Colwellia sp.]|nr:hypothetical protein [Colwellia sp.]